MMCNQCGGDLNRFNEIEDELLFCPYCGSPLTDLDIKA